MKRIKTILFSSFLVLSVLILFTPTPESLAFQSGDEWLSGSEFRPSETSVGTHTYLPLGKIEVSITPDTPDNGYYKEGETATFDIMITMTSKPIWPMIWPIWERPLPVIFGGQLQIGATFPDQETEVTLTYVSSGRNTWHYTYTTPPFTESSTPTLSVTASYRGLRGSASSTINVDAVAPLITDISPSSGEIRTERHPIISCTYSDDFSGIDITTVRLTVDGQDVTSFATITDTNIIYTPLPDYPLAYDLHQVEVEVADNAGNNTQSTWSFRITERSINTKAYPDWFYAGGEEPVLVTIMAYIYPDKDLSEVKLVQLDENNQIIDTLGELSDDGQNGDEQAGDNIYTIQRYFEEPMSIKKDEFDKEIILQVFADYYGIDPITVSSGIFSIHVFLYPTEPPLPLEGSLRLMTFNTQLLFTWHGSAAVDTIEDEYGIENEVRAEKIAEQILSLKALGIEPHIIALQEVFDEDAREVLDDMLKGEYKWRVYKLDAADLDEDSGLMLFSQYPFEYLPNQQYEYPGSNHTTAYIEFSAGSAEDYYSNKGVGFVQLDVGSGVYVNVAFTHTQASYGDGDYEDAMERVQDRNHQLGDVRRIIEGSLFDAYLEYHPIFVMGDLNINGNPKSMDGKWMGTKYEWDDMIDWDEDMTNYWYEWDYHFNRDLENSYFSTYFSDSWMYDTVSWIYDTVDSDPGETTGSDYFPYYLEDDPTQGERLDYILHNNNEVMASAVDVPPGIRKYVIQHIRRVWEPALKLDCDPQVDEVCQQFSDHLPVMADINWYAPYCNPLIAYDVVGFDPNADPPVQDVSIPGTIAYKGSMQWYRVDDQGGSYSIGTSSDVKFDVYEAKDLSRPIEWRGEWTRWGMQYSIPEVPFYIRVFSADPNWADNYSINIHLHLGKSKEDAILLEPLGFYEPNPYEYGYLYTMPTIGSPINPVFFKINPEWSSMDYSPSIKAIVDTIKTADVEFRMDLTNYFGDDYNVIADAYKLYSPYEDPQTEKITSRYQLEMDDLPYDSSGGAYPYYLRVHGGDNPDWLGKQFIIHWQTSLTYFLFAELRCIEQEDDTGNDDIYISIWLDVEAADRTPANAVLNKHYLDEFDDGGEDCEEYNTAKPLTLMNNYSFVDNMYIELWEYESNDDSYTYLGSETINTLPMNQEEVEKWVKWWKEGSSDCDPAFDYQMKGELKHQKPAQMP